MKILLGFAGVGGLFLLVVGTIVLWPVLPGIFIIGIGLGFGLAFAGGLAGIYLLIAHAQFKQAQAQAVLIEAGKVSYKHTHYVRNNQVIQLVQPQMLPTQLAPASAAALATPAMPELPAPAVLQVPASVLTNTNAKPEFIEMGPAHFRDFVPSNPFRNGELFIRLGVTGTGREIVRPITTLTHFLEAGKTQSGKSTHIRSLAAQTLIGELEQPGRAKVALIDLTGITFNDLLFDELPQTFGGQVATDADSAVEMLLALLTECKRRSKLYAQAKGLPESLPEYNAVVPMEYRLPVIMTFVEEMSALAEGIGDKFLSPLKQLIWQARKYGIYLNNAGQDFRAKTCDKSITDNSNSRFLFGRVEDATARVIGFDPKQHRVSEDKPGRGLVMLNGTVQEFQGLYLPKEEFVSLMNRLRAKAGLVPAGQGGQFNSVANPASKADFRASEGLGEGRVYNDTLLDFLTLPEPSTPRYEPAISVVEVSDLERARQAWTAGNTSVRKLAGALGCSVGKAHSLMQKIQTEGECSSPVQN